MPQEPTADWLTWGRVTAIKDMYRNLLMRSDWLGGANGT